MKTNINKSLILGAISALCIGTVIYSADLTIPTQHADHHGFLTKLFLGTGSDSQKQELSLDSNHETLVVPNKLIAGDTSTANKNQIGSTVQNAVIAGGSKNTIGANAHNSAIGAGGGNTIKAENATIGAGDRNTIEATAEGSFIGGGNQNTISAKQTTIAGGNENKISGENSVIIGGANNTISAKNSLAAGQYVNINQDNTFAWSDYHILYDDPYLEPTKDNTFIVRSNNGMAINTAQALTNVNVTLGGALYLGNEGLATNACTNDLKGTFERNDQGCYYYCDGLLRQPLNMGFTGADIKGQCAKGGTHIAETFCQYGSTTVRPGDKLDGYAEPISENCSTKEVRGAVCGKNGERTGPGVVGGILYPQCLQGGAVEGLCGTEYDLDSCPSNATCTKCGSKYKFEGCDTDYKAVGNTCVLKTGTANCANLSSNEVWTSNESTGTKTINQTSVSGVMTPSTSKTYNATDKTVNACNYKCNSTSTWNGSACIANTATLTVMPESITYTQNQGTTKSVTASAGTSYTVTFNANGGTPTNSTATSTKAFSKWTLAGGGSISSTTARTTTYTFGSTNGTLTASYAAAQPAVSCPAAPTKAGSTFNGRYTAASGGTKVCNAGGSYTPTANTTLYAQWSVACTNGGVALDGSAGISYVGTDIYIRDGKGCGFILQDRNVGAGGVNQIGKYFQWGNKIGFSSSSIPTNITSTAVSNISVNSTYSNSKFIQGLNGYNARWANNLHATAKNLRGDVTDNPIGTNRAARQGPCPSGYHVPSISEWQGVLKMGGDVGAWGTNNGQSLAGYNSEILTKLKIPKSGCIDYRGTSSDAAAGMVADGCYAGGSFKGTHLFSSTIANSTDQMVATFSIYTYGSAGAYNHYSQGAYGIVGYPVRCFKNTN